MRNNMLLIAMTVSVVGISVGNDKYFFIGGIIALTAIFLDKKG